MTSRIELFEAALRTSKQALARAPHMFPLESAISQLQYLIDLELGKTFDRAGLAGITIGQIAARDLENFDSELAALLHDVSAEAREMVSRPPLRPVD
jgi:hypothetical protein